MVTTVAAGAALEVLDAAGRINTALVTTFLGELLALTGSRDATVAVMAMELCEQGGASATHAPAPEQLPVGYRIVLPPNAFLGLTHADTSEAGEPWPDTEDPRQLLSSRFAHFEEG